MPASGASPRVLGVIPARGGSKGIPRKNLFQLHGQPLLAYTVTAALSSHTLTRTVLSTDDEEILMLGRELGVDAPFLRPAALAGDDVSSAEVARHALAFVEAEEQREYDALVLLEPTAPLRTANDVDEAVERLHESDADSVVTVCRVDAPHPVKMQIIEDGLLKPYLPHLWREGLTRQQLPPVYYLTGAVYAVRASVIRETGSLWGRSTAPVVMPPERSVNIDSRADLALAEVFLRNRDAG